MSTDNDSASTGAVESAENLYTAIREAFPDAAADFQSRWMAWQTVRQSQSVDSYVGTEEFESLKRLGPKIIPFVVYKLAVDTARSCHGVILYNFLEKDPTYRPNPAAPLVSKDMLRRQSIRIVELNHSRNRYVAECCQAWKEHCLENNLQSSTAVFTTCEPYWDLLELGPGIIAHIMVEYRYDWAGPYFELLHEIIHGRKMGAHVIQKPVLYDVWCWYFNYCEHHEVFRYIPTELDRRILGDKIKDFH